MEGGKVGVRRGCEEREGACTRTQPLQAACAEQVAQAAGGRRSAPKRLLSPGTLHDSPNVEQPVLREAVGVRLYCAGQRADVADGGVQRRHLAAMVGGMGRERRAGGRD